MRKINPGLIAEHGFEYQKQVYFYYIINFISTFNQFLYEGKDDIECKNTTTCSHFFVQAKTGKLNKATRKNILYNWLAIDMNKNSKFHLYLEILDSFDIASLKDEVIKDIEVGSGAHDSSNIKIAHEAYILNGIFDSKKLNGNFEIIEKNYECFVKDSANLLNDIFEVLKKEIYRNETIMDMQIEKRLIHILKELLLKINTQVAISKINPVNIEYSDVINLISEAKELYKLDTYNPDFTEFKKKYATYSIDNSLREVKEMKKVGIDDKSILSHLINEIFYDEFKHYYNSTKKDGLIRNIEEMAYTNYSDEKSKLKIQNKLSSSELFFNVISKSIGSYLLTKMNSCQFATRGCYISLTSDKVESDLQISWGINEDE